MDLLEQKFKTKLLLTLFLHCLFFHYAYSSTEEDFEKVATTFKSEKFNLYKFIYLGDSFGHLAMNFQSQKMELKKRCNNKMPKLCISSFDSHSVFGINQGTFVFYNDILIRGNILIDAKRKNRIDIINNLLMSKVKPRLINYVSDGALEDIKVLEEIVNLCNLKNDNNSSSVKTFLGLQWDLPGGTVRLRSKHKKNFLNNSFTQEDCETNVGDVVEIGSLFNSNLEEKFQSIVLEF